MGDVLPLVRAQSLGADAVAHGLLLAVDLAERAVRFLLPVDLVTVHLFRGSRQTAVSDLLVVLCWRKSQKSICLASHLGKDERSVVFEVDLAGAYGVDGGGATAEGALAGLLWSGVHGLPSSVAGRQVRSRHPAVIPHVEVPVWDVTFEAQTWRKKFWNVESMCSALAQFLSTLCTKSTLLVGLDNLLRNAGWTRRCKTSSSVGSM